MPKFSIIIPIYNAEKTLKRCLDSILSQTFSDYEVIMIDDGSIDSSNEICKRYCEQDKRFCLYSQTNSGPSKARNVGLDNAKGSWICFVDSDDYVSKDYLEKINDTIISEDIDSVFIGYYKVTESGIKEAFLPGEVLETTINTALVLSERDMFGYTWIKCFRRDAIKEIKFDTSLNLFEDEVFACQVLLNCRRICIVNNPIYIYNIGDESSLIRRTHEDYCLKCDRVYHAWKDILAGCPESAKILTNKANVFVSRCYYYAFEHEVNIQSYFEQLKDTAFFREHTEKNRFDKDVWNKRYKKLQFEKMKYQIKVRISAILNGKR